MSTAMVLELSEGCELVIDGEPWQVERLEPYWGRSLSARATALPEGASARPLSPR